MRKGIWILVVVAILVIIVVLSTSGIFDSKPGNAGNGAESRQADDFTLSDLNGNEVSLSDFRGKNVFLNFWSMGCPPCRAEMPDIEKVYQEYKDKDLVVLAVNLTEGKDSVKSFVAENGFNFTILFDSSGSVGSSYRINAIPASFFIDKEGNVKKSILGMMTEADMRSYIEALE